MKKSFLCFLLGLLLLAPVAAQVNVDSLRRVAGDEKAADSSRFLAVDQLANFYHSKLPDSALYLAEQLFTLAQAKQDQRAMANALLHKGVYYGRKGKMDLGLGHLKQSLEIFEALGEPEKIAQALTETGTLYKEQGEYGLALDYLRRSLKMAETLGNELKLARTYANIGNVCFRQGDYSQALENHRKSLAIYRREGRQLGVAGNLGDMGNIYLYRGDYPQALAYYDSSRQILETLGHLRNVSVILENMGGVYVSQGDYARALIHFQRSLKLSEDLDDPLGVASNLNNIGRIYVDQGAYARALPYFERSLEIFETSGYQAGQATTLSDIGKVYEKQNRDEEALAYYNRSLKLCETMGNQAGMAEALTRIGHIYLEREDYAQALAQHQQSLQIREKLADQHGIAVSLRNMGTIYQRQNDYVKARQYGEQALSVGQTVGNVSVLQGIYQLLYQTYKVTGQATQALAMHERYLQMRDSLNREENQRATIRFEFERQALADSLANEQEKAVAQLEYENQLSQQRLQLGFVGGVGGLLAILAFVLYRNNQRRRRTNQLLSDQNKVIETKSNQNELLLKEIHHRVKNNLQTISSLLYLQSAHIQDAEVKEAVAAGQHRVESMALIHQKLYQRDNLAGIEMKDYLSNLGDSLLSTFDYDPERIELHLDMEALELDVDTAVPLGLIVNELITNALKYAFPGGRSGEIRLSLKRLTGGKLELLVADDGVGKSEVSGGTSFGSQLVNLLTMQLGGKIEQGQEDGYWTRVVV